MADIMANVPSRWRTMTEAPEWLVELTREEFVARFSDRFKPSRDWEICVRYYAGEPLATIALDYGITPQAVGLVAHQCGMPRRQRRDPARTPETP